MEFTSNFSPMRKSEQVFVCDLCSTPPSPPPAASNTSNIPIPTEKLFARLFGRLMVLTVTATFSPTISILASFSSITYFLPFKWSKKNSGNRTKTAIMRYSWIRENGIPCGADAWKPFLRIHKQSAGYLNLWTWTRKWEPSAAWCLPAGCVWNGMKTSNPSYGLRFRPNDQMKHIGSNGDEEEGTK